MKTITVWQPWASLIIKGWKRYEFRSWPAPPALIGQRIVIHAGSRVPRATELQEIIENLQDVRTPLAYQPLPLHDMADRVRALELLRRPLSPAALLPRGAGLGTAILGTPVRVTDLFRPYANDQDIQSLDPNKWAWPLTGIEEWASPVPATGCQGFWEWRT